MKVNSFVFTSFNKIPAPYRSLFRACFDFGPKACEKGRIIYANKLNNQALVNEDSLVSTWIKEGDKIIIIEKE